MSVAPIFPDIGRFHAVLRSVQEFDNAEILPVVKGLLSPTDREYCFIAAYYRTVANARSILALNNSSHFQAIAMLSRGMFELAVDVRLIDGITDAVAKIYAFSDSERLRAARDVVAFSKGSKSSRDVTDHEAFIASKAASIELHRKALWPKLKAVKHWSGMGLRDRARQLKAPFEEIYESEYSQLSWLVHPGLAGVVGLDVAAFPAMCGLALKVAFEAYAEVLRATAAELKINKAVDKLNEKIQLAMLLPFTDTPEQAQQLGQALLG